MGSLPSQTAARFAKADGHVLLLALLVMVGVVLRVPSYSNSLHGDEMATYFDVTGHGVGRILDIVQGDQEVTPPLYLLLAGWTQGLGDPQDSLRLVPFLCGVAAIPLTWLLGARTLDRRAGTVAAALMALSPFLIFYSTEARAYGLALLLTLGSTLALHRAVRGGEKGPWALYALLSCAAMYTHYTTAFVLVGQALWGLAYHRAAWRYLAVANVAAAVAWLPWLNGYRADQASPGAALVGLLQPFGWDVFKTDVLHWAISHPLLSFSVKEMPGRLAVLSIAVALLIGLVGGALEAGRRWRGLRAPEEGLALVLVLALSTPVLAAVYSALSVSVFLPRNLISSSPGLMLALAWTVTRPRPRGAWAPATALLITGFAIGGLRMLEAEAQRPDYKGVARFVAKRGGPKAVIVDVAGLSPGPLSSLDAATSSDAPEARRSVVLRLGRPERAVQLRADRPGGPGQFAELPTPSAQAIASQAVRLAGNRDIYLIDPEGTPLPDLLIPPFLAALPSGYRRVEVKRFPGFFGDYPINVMVLRKARDAG